MLECCVKWLININDCTVFTVIIFIFVFLCLSLSELRSLHRWRWIRYFNRRVKIPGEIVRRSVCVCLCVCLCSLYPETSYIYLPLNPFFSFVCKHLLAVNPHYRPVTRFLASGCANKRKKSLWRRFVSPEFCNWLWRWQKKTELRLNSCCRLCAFFFFFNWHKWILSWWVEKEHPVQQKETKQWQMTSHINTVFNLHEQNITVIQPPSFLCHFFCFWS